MEKPKIRISNLIESEDMVQILSRCYTAAREADWSIEKTRKFSEATTTKDFKQFLETVSEYFEIEDVNDAIFDSVCKEAEIQVVARCRLCGKRISGVTISIYELMAECANNTSFHICDDGSVGILEVIGGTGLDVDSQMILRQMLQTPEPVAEPAKKHTKRQRK